MMQMAFNNGFPVGYQPYGIGYPPMFGQPTQMQGAQVPQTNQPTKYVEVVPVDSVEEAQNCPMAAGSSFLFFARDDSFIAVKSIGVNGQQSFSVFDKRPPAPPKPPIDLTKYVTRDELEKRLAGILAGNPARVETEGE